jgi:dihydropteroate synthase type 2
VKGRPAIFGVLNITEDSFSDGGLYLQPEKAIEHGLRLIEAGADALDLGPASSNPDAKPVPPTEEIRRLEPVVERLGNRIALSVDSFRPETQLWAVNHGAAYLNDIHGFPRREIYPELALANCKLIVMHSIQSDWKAERAVTDPATIFERVADFLQKRVSALVSAGIAGERLIIDPGMGYFLGSNAEPCIVMLQNIARLKERLGLPVMVSVSRKSFLRTLTGRDTKDLGAATLATELHAASAEVDYIRTHDVSALRDALTVLESLGH